MLSGVCSLAALWPNCAAWETPKGGEKCLPMCSPPWASRTHHPVHPVHAASAAAEPCPHSPGTWQNKGPPETGRTRMLRWGAGPSRNTAEPRPELRATVSTVPGAGREGLQAFAAGFAQRKRKGMVRPQARLTDLRRRWSTASHRMAQAQGCLHFLNCKQFVLHGGWGGSYEIHSRPQTLGSKSRIISSKCCLH